MALTVERAAELNELCRKFRIDVLTAIYGAQSGHPGGALSVADFTAACYFHFMNIDPTNPKWEDHHSL